MSSLQLLSQLPLLALQLLTLAWLTLLVHTLDVPDPTCSYGVPGWPSPQTTDPPYTVTLGGRVEPNWEGIYFVNDNILDITLVSTNTSNTFIRGFYVRVESVSEWKTVGFLQARMFGWRYATCRENGGVRSMGIVSDDDDPGRTAPEVSFEFYYYGDEVPANHRQVRANVTVFQSEGVYWTMLLSDIFIINKGVPGTPPSNCSLYDEPQCVLPYGTMEQFNSNTQQFCQFASDIIECINENRRVSEGWGCGESDGYVVNKLDNHCTLHHGHSNSNSAGQDTVAVPAIAHSSYGGSSTRTPELTCDYLLDSFNCVTQYSSHESTFIQNIHTYCSNKEEILGCIRNNQRHANEMGCNNQVSQQIPNALHECDCEQYDDTCGETHLIQLVANSRSAQQICRHTVPYLQCVSTPPPGCDTDVNDTHNSRLVTVYACAANLPCSSEYMSSCTADHANTLQQFSNLLDITHTTYTQEQCMALHAAVVCILDLPQDCTADWLPWVSQRDVYHSLLDSCPQVATTLQSQCDSSLQQCAGSEVYSYFQQLVDQTYLWDDQYCRNLRPVYDCIKTIHHSCPLELLSIYAALPDEDNSDLLNLMTECVGYTGGYSCQRDLAQCTTKCFGDQDSEHLQIHCLAKYECLSCVQSHRDASPDCYDEWYTEYYNLWARDTLIRTCPEEYDDCTMNIKACLQRFTVPDWKTSFCDSSDYYYDCTVSHPHCTLNPDVYPGPHDPEELRDQVLQRCDYDPAAVDMTVDTSTASKPTPSYIYTRILLCCAAFIIFMD